MMAGQVIILNGAPRAGKSSIARAVQVTAPALWLNLGVDSWMAATPEQYRPGIGLRPGGERADLEPVVRALYCGLFGAIAAESRAGLNLVSDLGIHDCYSKPLGIWQELARALTGLPVLLVGVRCPIETIMARRNADKSGRYLGGDAVPEPVRLWQEDVHKPGIYDLDVDTSIISPEQCAARIFKTLQSAPHRFALSRLA